MNAWGSMAAAAPAPALLLPRLCKRELPEVGHGWLWLARQVEECSWFADASSITHLLEQELPEAT